MVHTPNRDRPAQTLRKSKRIGKSTKGTKFSNREKITRSSERRVSNSLSLVSNGLAVTLAQPPPQPRAALLNRSAAPLRNRHACRHCKRKTPRSEDAVPPARQIGFS